MKPRLIKLRKAFDKSQKTVLDVQTGLINLAGDLQSDLAQFVFSVVMPSLDVRDGIIVNSTKNLKKINNSTSLKAFLRQSINKRLVSYYTKSFLAINKNTASYYDNFSPSESIRQQILNRANLGADGFMESLFDNNQVQRQIQDTLRGGVSSSLSVEDLQATLKQQIEGTEDKFGALQSFHYSNGRDEFQRYKRGLDNEFSVKLNLNYAIYQGGEINTTRQFCETRNGNTYNRETIESWQNLNFQGKMEGHDIFIDAGGYNCRHDYGWISYELAKRRDPDIEKSKYDTK